MEIGNETENYYNIVTLNLPERLLPIPSYILLNKFSKQKHIDVLRLIFIEKLRIFVLYLYYFIRTAQNRFY